MYTYNPVEPNKPGQLSGSFNQGQLENIIIISIFFLLDWM